MNGSGAGYYKYLHAKYAKKPQIAEEDKKPKDEGDEKGEDGFLGLFNRSEAAKKGWETRKKGGWTPGVWPKQGGSTAPAPKPAAPATPSPLSILPKHLTQNRLKNETDANRAMAGG